MMKPLVILQNPLVFYDKETAERIEKEKHYSSLKTPVVDRRVVPSPQPKSIVELKVSKL